MLEKITQLALENKNISDFHLRGGSDIAYRALGDIIIEPDSKITDENLNELLKKNCTDEEIKLFEKKKELDTAVMLGELRFRANFYKTLNNQINEGRQSNIITIEDPVEFIHNDKKSIVSQREVGKQTESFAHALKGALREDPDVILVGELRDLETIGMALTAAETGHLVFGTLHTSGAPNTINRIIDVFPPEQQGQIRAQIAESLKMVVTQKLFKKKDGSGRIGAFEVMVCNAPIKNLIREAKIHQIPSVMQTAQREGMMTMEKSIEDLVGTGVISSADKNN